MMRTAAFCLAALALWGCGPAPRVHTGTGPRYAAEPLVGLEEALALNNAGAVVGRMPQGALGIWQAGRVERVAAVPSGYYSRCAINSAGDLLVDMPVRSEGGRVHAFIVRGGETTDLGTLGGLRSEGMDLNDKGQAAVMSDAAVGRDALRACRWSMGRLEELPSPRQGARAEAISGRGDIAGALSGPEYRSSAAVWRGQDLVRLGTLGGRDSVATDINDAGLVVGWSGLAPGSSRVHAVMWRDGRCIDLTSAGSPNSQAVAVNNRGQVVGTVEVEGGGTRGFVYTDGRLVDLSSALQPGGVWTIAGVRAINDRGQILAVGARGPLLLTPVQ